MPAFPLIRAVYLGIAVGAHNSAAGLARRKASGHTIGFVGRMDTELMAAELALEGMMAAMAGNAPSTETVNRVMMGRSLAARHALAVGDLALEAAAAPARPRGMRGAAERQPGGGFPSLGRFTRGKK